MQDETTMEHEKVRMRKMVSHVQYPRLPIRTNQTKKPPSDFSEGGWNKEGGYLLSRLRSTIGVTGLNFSVRNGKRWNPGAITTRIS